MTILEITIFSINEHLVATVLHVSKLHYAYIGLWESLYFSAMGCTILNLRRGNNLILNLTVSRPG